MCIKQKENKEFKQNKKQQQTTNNISSKLFCKVDIKLKMYIIVIKRVHLFLNFL